MNLIRLHVLVHGDIHSGVVGVPCLIHLDELSDAFFAIDGLRHREKRHGVYLLSLFANLPLLIGRDHIVPETFRPAAHPDNAARITIRHAVGLIYPTQRGGRGDTVQSRRNETRPERTLAKLGQCRTPRLIFIKLRLCLLKHKLGVLLLHVTQRFPGVELLLLQPDFLLGDIQLLARHRGIGVELLLLQCPVGIRLLRARLKLRPLRLGLRSKLLRLHRYLRSNSLPLQSSLMRPRLSGLPDLD